MKKLKQNILDIILLLTLAVIPLTYSASFYNSFRLLKTTFFITLVSVALIFAVLVYIKRNIYFWKKYKVLLIILGAFFIFKIISLILSINHHISFWGGYSKLEGFLTWSFYITFFLILLFNFIDKKKRKIYVFIIVCSMFVLAIISILQHYGLIGDKWSGSVQMRPIGSLGNPLHLGALMMFAAPLSLYAFYRFKHYGFKIFFGLTLALQLLVLIFTRSRSSWATFTILAIILGFLYLFKNTKGANKKWLVTFSVLAVILVSTFIYIGKTNPNVIPSEYVKRSFSVLDSEDPSNKQRIYFWKGSWDAFRARPWFGWGEDNLNLAFDQNYPPKLTDLPETRIDRAHNVLLDILVEEGIFAFITFMAFLGYLLYLSFKLFFKKDDNEKNWIGFLGIWFVLGYLLQYFFMYPVISAYIIIFFVFSQVATVGIINTEKLQKIDTVKILKSKQAIIASPFIIIFLAILIFGTIPRIQGNWTFTQALKNPKKADQLFSKAYETWPSPHLRLRLGSHYMQKAFALAQNNPAAAEAYFKKSQGIFLQDIEKFPDNYISLINVGSVYNVFGLFEVSDKYFKKAASLVPARQDVYWTWAGNARIRNDLNKSVELYKKAIEIDPDVAYPYQQLAIFYKKMGTLAQADQYFNFALKKGLRSAYKKEYENLKAPKPQNQDLPTADSEIKSE